MSPKDFKRHELLSNKRIPRVPTVREKGRN